MDLTIGRLLQISQAIAARRRQDNLRECSYIEWQTKGLGHIIAAGAMVDKPELLQQFVAEMSMFPSKGTAEAKGEPESDTYVDAHGRVLPKARANDEAKLANLVGGIRQGRGGGR